MKNKFNETKKSGEILVTVQMLEATRAELKTAIVSSALTIRDEMNARFSKVDERFDTIDSRFEAIDERFDKMEAHFIDFKKEMMSIYDRSVTKAAEHSERILALTEQQKAENVYVLDQYQEVQRVQKDHEERLCKIEDEGFCPP